MGLLLRWYVACAEMARFRALSSGQQADAFGAFGDAVRDMAERFELSIDASAVASAGAPVETSPTVFCLDLPRGAGDVYARWLALMEARDGKGFHLGKPHERAPGRWVLRLACGAPLAVEIASHGVEALRIDLAKLGPRLQRALSSAR